MRKIRKVTTLLMCMLFLGVSFTGCNKADGGNLDTLDETIDTTTEEKNVESIDFSEPVEYTYWLSATPNEIESDYSKNSVVQFMNKKFNMNITFQQPSSGTETDSLNLMFGTGEYTDVIDSSYYTGSIDKLFSDGIIIDIAKYLDYMPNLKALLDADQVFKRNVYNDYGQILKLPTYITEDPLHWGGLVYRRDILESMTGNNVTFPSGNDSPTTIADWDYMLPLFKQYFEAAGMTEYAPLIIPATGYFTTSELVNSFGAASSYYTVDGKIQFGPIQDGFYNYLVKMNEWYDKGYIYQDFPSRTNDLFYLPNTSLTYGGAAGVWFGLTGQLGDLLSMPEYGLNFDVQPLLNPIDSDNGITSAPNMMYAPRNDQYGGAMVTTSCENVERLLATMDYMYTDEAAMLKEYGITKEQGASDYELYQKYELTDGAYTVDSDGTFSFNEKIAPGSGLLPDPFVEYKMPGMRNNKYTNELLDKAIKEASAVWLYYGYDKLPPIYRTEEEENTFISNQAAIEDYVNTMVLKFILGSEKLDQAAWESYVERIESLGINDNINIMQASFDRYQKR